MVEYCKRYYFIKVCESWFDYRFSIVDVFRIKAYLHLKHEIKAPPGVKNVTYTIENSLEQNVDDLFLSFSKNIRSGIRKAEKMGITTCFKIDIPAFVKFYNAFAVKKHIPKTSERRLLELGDNLRLGYAVYEGKTLAAHSYLFDKDESIVRILWGCSARLDEQVDRKMAGLANRLLYFNSMVHFKEEGIKTYDWGGYAKNTKDDQLKGINNIKKQFGGEVVACCNYLTYGYFVLHTLAQVFGILGEVY